MTHYGDTGRAGNPWRPQEMDASAHLGIDLENPEHVAQLAHATPVTPTMVAASAVSAAPATPEASATPTTATWATPAAQDAPDALHAPVEPVTATFQEARHYDTQVASEPEKRKQPELPHPDRSEPKGKPRVIVWGNFPNPKG